MEPADQLQQIDERITDKVSAASITPFDVGDTMKNTLETALEYADGIVQNSMAASTILAPSVSAVNGAIANAITGVYQIAGEYDASIGTFPTVGTGDGGSVAKGDVYRVTTAGTLGGVSYSINDTFYALVDNPSQTAGNWARFQTNTGQATESTLGTVRYATDADVVAGVGQGTVNPKQLADKLNSFVPSLGYKEYKAYFTQSGTSNPSVTVIKNTLGGTVNWVRELGGYYTGTLTGAFTTNKTFISNSKFTYDNQGGSASPKNVRINRDSLNQISVQTFAGTAPADVGISNMSIEIYVYN